MTVSLDTLEQSLPRYARAMSRLGETIAGMKVGDRLLSERELAVKLGVSRPTLRKALGASGAQDIIEVRRGAGTFVRKHVAWPAPRATATRLIGLSVPTVEVPAIARVVTGVGQRASEAGFRLVLAHDQGDPSLQEQDVRQLLGADVDGLMIFLDRDNVVRPAYLDLLRQLSRQPKPVVLLDRYVPDVDLPCVLTDTVRGMYEATQHLLMSGRRRFAVLSWGAESGVAEQNRFTGFANALRDYGLPPTPVLHAALGYDEAHESAARRVVAEWLGRLPRPLPFDAIVCFIDSMAHGAFLALKDAGVRVPEDVALVGFDNLHSEVYRLMGLDLTSVEQPFFEMGRAAMDMILARLQGDGPAGAGRHVLLRPKLIVRSSCGEQMPM